MTPEGQPYPKKVQKIADKIDSFRSVGAHESGEFVELVLDALRRRAKRLQPAKQQPIIEFLNNIENK